MFKKNDYQELLKDPRWIKKRNQILSRDKNTCRYCGCQDKYMQVHHKEYWRGHLPWEYPDNLLVTLCEDCHHLMHQAKDRLCDVEIGQVYNRYHSDYRNTCIVYSIDYERRLISTLECDDGAGTDSIYDETSSFSYFYHNYNFTGEEAVNDYWFWLWLNYISKNLEETPKAFQYRWEEILANNPTLVEMLKIEESYYTD